MCRRGCRVAVVTFSDFSERYSDWDSEFTLEGALASINALVDQETGGGTNTGNALNLVNQMQTLIPGKTGFRGFSEEKLSLVLLITDGKPDSETSAVTTAQTLKDNGNKTEVKMSIYSIEIAEMKESGEKFLDKIMFTNKAAKS